MRSVSSIKKQTHGRGATAVYHEVLRGVTRSGHEHVLQITIRVDTSYDFQSEASIHVWNGEALSWNCVFRIAPGGLASQKALNKAHGGTSGRFEPKEDLFLTDVAELLRVADEVLT